MFENSKINLKKYTGMFERSRRGRFLLNMFYWKNRFEAKNRPPRRVYKKHTWIK